MSYAEFAADGLIQVQRLAAYATSKDAKEALEVMRRELSMDMAAMRPCLSLRYAVEMTARLPRLQELNAPAIILDFTKMQLEELPEQLARVEPKNGLRFFEHEPTGEHRQNGLAVRHLRWCWNEPAPSDRESVLLDVSTPFLACLERDPALWEQQLAVLEASAGAWASVKGELTGSWMGPPLEGPLTVAVLRNHLAAKPEYWRGAREAPFLLGRVAHLIGAPPEEECPAISLEVEVGGFRFTAGAADSEGAGIPLLYLDSDQGVVEERHVRALEEILLGDTRVADVRVEGYDGGCGVAFALGVRTGRLFAEGHAAPAPPFHIAR